MKQRRQMESNFFYIAQIRGTDACTILIRLIVLMTNHFLAFGKHLHATPLH